MKVVRVNVRLPGVNMRTVVSSPTPAFHAYHGVTNAEHQAHIDRCSLQSYRMISLSVYGDRIDHSMPRFGSGAMDRHGKRSMMLTRPDTKPFLMSGRFVGTYQF